MASASAFAGLWRATGSTSSFADIEKAQLEIARRELATFNVRTRAIEVDVSDAAAFERAADEAEAEFGNKMAPSALPCSARILTGFDSIARYNARERPT